MKYILLIVIVNIFLSPVFTDFSEFNLLIDIFISGCAIFNLISKKINKYLLYFLLAFIFSAIISLTKPDVAIVQLRSLIFPFLFIETFKNTFFKHKNFFIKSLTIIFLATSIIALVESLLGYNLIVNLNRYGNDFYGIHRSRSIIGNPIDLSHFLILIALIINEHVPNSKFKYFIIIIGFAAFFTTRSRGPLLAILISIIIIFPWKKIIRYLYKYILLIIPFIIFFIYNISTRFQNLNISDLQYDLYRFSWLISSIEMFFNKPIFGYGPGSFGGWVSINYELSPLYELYDISTFGISSIDMFWPHILVELGIVGTMAYIFYLKRAFVQKSTNALIAFYYVIIASFFSICLESPLVLIAISLLFIYEKKDNSNLLHDGSF
tara:strand:+ start:2978 stop:4114 length:1137 start_codon:yes stop_codon:yes gene_type:complete